ncbi:hypothetical protein AB0P17_24685 [Streptomyces sp. NPDC088124]|uniref:hypothetical protein n=1 Tax=Streptomyces sp. NPDC088124 TaxID=3154654 RepID=UPI003444C681
MPPERREGKEPEKFEGAVVGLGGGCAGVDTDRALVWARLENGTERQCPIREAPAEAVVVVE